MLCKLEISKWTSLPFIFLKETFFCLSSLNIFLVVCSILNHAINFLSSEYIIQVKQEHDLKCLQDKNWLHDPILMSKENTLYCFDTFPLSFIFFSTNMLIFQCLIINIKYYLLVLCCEHCGWRPSLLHIQQPSVIFLFSYPFRIVTSHFVSGKARLTISPSYSI